MVLKKAGGGKKSMLGPYTSTDWRHSLRKNPVSTQTGKSAAARGAEKGVKAVLRQ